MDPQNTVSLALPGVPPSWQNWRGHWRRTWPVKKLWRVRANICAQDARNRMQWDKPVDGGKAVVAIVLKRVKELDHDNAYSSIKPILDGLQGALIFSDAPSFCELSVRQEKVKHYVDQLTVITVTRLAETIPPAEQIMQGRRRHQRTTQEDVTRADIQARNEAELEGSR